MTNDYIDRFHPDYQNLTRAQKVVNLPAQKTAEAARNGNGQAPPTDPWAPGVRAADVPVFKPEPEPAASGDDHKAIRSHVTMLHKLAGDAGVDGILTFTRFVAKGSAFTERFTIGDVDYMADAIVGYTSNPHTDIYLSWVIWRKDLPRTSSGGEADIVVVLALVGDLDSDKGKKAVSLAKLPLAAPYVVETSAGNYHATFPLQRALTVAEAKPIAIALSNAIGGDTGTKDTSHLWRIPGTLNWPCQT